MTNREFQFLMVGAGVMLLLLRVIEYQEAVIAYVGGSILYWFVRAVLR